MSKNVDSEWKRIKLSHLQNNTHLYCSCMTKTLQTQKEHPEYLAVGSGFNPCERCGTWDECLELCKTCEKEVMKH